MQNIRVGNLMIDCADAQKLRDFYAALLNGTPVTLYGMPGVRVPEGIAYLFSQEEDYVPPVWPEEPGRQQKQVHVDYQVPDLPAAVAQAEALGAVKAEVQFGGEDFVTLLDPAGHPFCLCSEGNPE